MNPLYRISLPVSKLDRLMDSSEGLTCRPFYDTVGRAGTLEKDNAAGSSQWEESEKGIRRVVEK